MKKITLFLFTLNCFMGNQCFSQICPPISSQNNSSLDWENLTTFTFYLTSNGGAPSFKVSPFFATQTSCNENITPFCNPPLQNRDISSADGWRYVNHDFGSPSDAIECPVFVLYNIYSGILRVFFYQSLTVVEGDAAVISLEHAFGSRTTALLEHYKGSIKNAVQVFDNAKDKKAIIPNTYLRSPSWQYADFFTQYDPCTCEFASLYRIKLVATQTSKISFTLNGQLKQDIKANQVNGGTAGVTLKSGGDGLTAIGNFLGIGSGSAPNPYANIFNAASLAFGNLGKIVKVVDFFAGLFKEESTSPKPTPLVFNANLSGSGSIITTNPLQMQPLNTPGSNQLGVDAENEPVYNNILGTFSLLQTPNIRLTNYTQEDCSYYDNPDYGSELNCTTQNFCQLENLSDIKWVLNPDAQLSVSNLVAAYVINTNSGMKIESEPYPLDCFNSYKPVYNIGNGAYNSMFSWGNFQPYVTSVYLKITGIFDASNNQKMVYSSLYKVNLDVSGGPYLDFVEEFPDPSCNSITPSASAAEIQAVCSSAQYTSRRDQFFVAPKDGSVDAQGASKNGVKSDNSLQIAPNPANNSVEIQYALKSDGNVKIGIYDLAGRMIKSLANNNDVKQGQYILQADISDMTSGMYLVLLDVNGKTEAKKLSVMKK